MMPRGAVSGQLLCYFCRTRSWNYVARPVHAFASKTVVPVRRWTWGTDHDDHKDNSKQENFKFSIFESPSMPPKERGSSSPSSSRGIHVRSKTKTDEPDDRTQSSGETSNMEDILSQSAHRAAIEAQKRQEQVDAFSRAPTEEAEKARDRVEWLLGRRSYTRKRLEDKLLFKGFSSEAVDWALDCVEAWGKLSDETYARDYARERWRVQRWAPKRISYELRKRGVSRDVIERVLLWLRTEGQVQRRYDGSFSEAPDEAEAEGIMRAQLVEEARMRLRQMGPLPRDKQRQRISGWLARGGHDWDTAAAVLEEIGIR